MDIEDASRFNKNWSRREIKKLNKLLKDNNSIEEIAEELKRTEGAIRTKIYSLKKKGVIDDG